MSAADARARARLRLFGGFGITDSDDAPIIISSRRARGLIAYLHLAPDGGAHRERLCGLLWSDRPEAQARASLRQCLFELRDELARAGLDILDVGRERVALLAGTLSSDVADLRAGLAAQDAEAVVAELEHAGRGGLLDGLELGGLFQDWLDQERPRVDQTIATAVHDLLAALEAQRQWPRLQAVAEAWLHRDPLDEAVVAAAIHADAALGASAAAHRRYQTLKSGLAKAFGVTPGAVVADAIERIGAPVVPVADVAQTGEPILAVLAFDNLSGDPETAYFSDGVSAEIQQAVAGAVDLKVLARSSSFQFRGADKAVRHVADSTKATHVLDGSVRRSGARVRVTTELVTCMGELTLWSARFDRDLTDVFALQDEIAAAVAAALKVAFSPAPAAGPIEPAAYDLYLRTRDAAVPMDPAERVAKLRQVVDEAPRYAPARAWLAWWQGFYVVNMDHERPYQVDRGAARRDAEAALKLDPRSAVAYAALSWLEPMGHYAEREELLRKALAAAPNDPLSLWNMAGFLDQVGRSLDALVYARRSYELDPLEPHAAGYVAGMYFRMGRYDEGQALAEECRLRWPGHWWFITPMIAFATHQRDWERFDAMVELARAAGLDRTSATRRTITYGYALRDNDREFAERLVGDIERNLATRGAPRLDWLTAAQEFGLMDELFSAVDRADYLSLINDVGVKPGGDFPLAQIFDLTVNRAMIRDIRFVGLCAKLGLCDYWVTSDCWPDCAYQTPYEFKAEGRRLVRG